MSHNGIFFYIIVPMVPILCFNLICFIRTSSSLCCGLWSDDAESTTKLRAKSVMKIFVITGICWIAEILGWLAHHLTSDASDEVRELVSKIIFAMDLINSLQGLTLFLALVSNHLTWKFSFTSSLSAVQHFIGRIRDQWTKKNQKRKYNLELDSMPNTNTTNEQFTPSFKQTSFNEC